MTQCVLFLTQPSFCRNPTRDEKLDIAESYADFLRDESWQLGGCDDDLVILVVKDDRVVSILVDNQTLYMLLKRSIDCQGDSVNVTRLC